MGEICSAVENTLGGIFMRACSSSNGLLTLGVPYPRWLRSGEYPIASLDWEGRYRW